MPSSQDFTRQMLQSWSELPADVRAAYERRASQASGSSPSPSGQAHYLPGRGQRSALATFNDNIAGPRQVAVSSSPSQIPSQYQSYYHNHTPSGGSQSFRSPFPLDAGPHSGPFEVSLGAFPSENQTTATPQSGPAFLLGYQDISTLANLITAYNIPYQQLHVVASNASVAPSSAQFSACYPGSQIPGATTPATPHSVHYYLSTLSTPQLMALQEYVQMPTGEMASRLTTNQEIAGSTPAQFRFLARGVQGFLFSFLAAFDDQLACSSEVDSKAPCDVDPANADFAVEALTASPTPGHRLSTGEPAIAPDYTFTAEPLADPYSFDPYSFDPYDLDTLQQTAASFAVTAAVGPPPDTNHDFSYNFNSIA
ncbi:hypothetical protein NMY22_g6613 [Coprinellus aureogranulatus]|nr:hypothetical protein NMY22_g6613 [Coprinellus aureogranulatus]